MNQTPTLSEILLVLLMEILLSSSFFPFFLYATTCMCLWHSCSLQVTPCLYPCFCNFCFVTLFPFVSPLRFFLSIVFSLIHIYISYLHVTVTGLTYLARVRSLHSVAHDQAITLLRLLLPLYYKRRIAPNSSTATSFVSHSDWLKHQCFLTSAKLIAKSVNTLMLEKISTSRRANNRKYFSLLSVVSLLARTSPEPRHNVKVEIRCRGVEWIPCWEMVWDRRTSIGWRICGMSLEGWKWSVLLKREVF